MKIFSGDKVRVWKNFNCGSYPIGVVEYDAEEAMFIITKEGDYGELRLWLVGENIKHVEVIGNIHNK